MSCKINWISFYTLLRREFVRILNMWPETLLPSVVTMSLYFMIFGSIMGSRIGDMNGVPYIQYIVPGLVMMAIINSAYINVAFSFYLSRFQRNIEEILTAPMSNATILGGYVGGGMIRGLLVGCLVLIVSLLFTKLNIYSWSLTLLISILTAGLLSLGGLVNGIFAKNFDGLSIVPMFVLTPLTYLGGVFYSVDLLPPVWRTLTYFNPIFYMVSGFRYAMSGVADINIEYAIAVLLILILILYTACIWLLHKGVGVKT
jgi:ABC-type polysaccharide/polyol phosphate export systems, permease component